MREYVTHFVHPLPDMLVPHVLDTSQDEEEETQGGGEALLGSSAEVDQRDLRLATRINIEKALAAVDKQTRDSVKQYLDEIGKIPLLTEDQERQYAQDVDRGVFIREERQGKSAKETTVALINKLHKGRHMLFNHFPPHTYTQEGILAALEASHGVYPATLKEQVQREHPELAEIQDKKKREKEIDDLAQQKGDEEIEPYSLAALSLPRSILEAYALALEKGQSELVLQALSRFSTADLRDHFDELERKSTYAREQLFVSNLRLGVTVAAKFVDRGVLLPDLIQGGSFGLDRAVDKYDYRKGYRFSTYAYPWIQQGVRATVAEEAKNIRIPPHMIELIGVYGNVAGELEVTLGREPTVEEVALAMDLSVEQVERIQEAIKKVTTRSLEQSISENEELGLGGSIPDSDAINQVEHVIDAEKAAVLRSVLERILTPRQVTILLLRFGVEDGRERILDDIAEELGFSRETIRKEEKKALRKLRESSLLQSIRTYFDFE